MRRLRICFLMLPPFLLLPILFLQSIFLTQPSIYSIRTHHPPACSPETELLVLVDSLPANSDLRRMIRATWGNTTSLAPRLQLVFLLGSEESGDVDRDQEADGEDIVFANTGSLPILAGLEWSVSACPQVLKRRKTIC